MRVIAQSGVLRILLCWMLVISSWSCLNTERLPELQRLANETPLFPGFVQFSSVHSGRRDHVALSFFYKSTHDFPEVKRFYLEALQPKGWTAREEPEPGSFFYDPDDGGVRIIFVKGNYKIIVQHNPGSSRWQYSMDYIWEAK